MPEIFCKIDLIFCFIHQEDSQLGKYTPKYLLAMSQQQLDNDNDDNEKLSSSSDVKKEAADIAVPLRDEEAISFSVSSSDDLLF